jgi:aminomethyltransferase
VTPGVPLCQNEREVGSVASIASSPRLGLIGLALVRREAEPGDILALGDTGCLATVVELPFGGAASDQR